MEYADLRVMRDQQAPQDQRDKLVTKEHKDPEVLPASKERRVLTDFQDLLDWLEKQDHKERLDYVVTVERQVPSE